MTHNNRYLILFISLSVLLFKVISASPVFEPEGALVEENAPEDAGFERSNDGFPDMNDFNFEPNESLGGQAKEQDAANQSVEQMDDDGPPSSGHARERPSMMSGDVNKATAEDQEGNEGGDVSDEAQARPQAGEPGSRKQKYQDGDEPNSARSLDQFEPFDKEADMNLDKNEFNENNADEAGPNGGRGGSGEEHGPREGHLPIPAPALQIDEPIIVNGPMPMHGGRPPMSGRSNSEENEGGKYNEQSKPPKHHKKESHKESALGYKFLPSGIKYIMHEKPGVSKTRIAQPNLASLTADHPQLAAGNLFKVFDYQKPKTNQVLFNPLHGSQQS